MLPTVRRTTSRNASISVYLLCGDGDVGPAAVTHDEVGQNFMQCITVS